MKVESIEKRVYSQNGEDGIIDYLVSQLPECGEVFVEIGCGDGSENNTTNLVMQGWSGFVVDGKPARISKYKERGFNKVTAECLKVTPQNVIKLPIPRTPDVFSLDIDSTDYHVLSALLSCGFRPSIMVLEYNAAFHLAPITVPAKMPKIDKHRYFGCGVMAWRKLIEPLGYTFATVDSSGVNAFFTLHGVGSLEPLEWADCKALSAVAGNHVSRFKEIQNLPLEYV